MKTNTVAQYSFGSLNKKLGFEQGYDGGTTLVYETKESKNIPLYAVIGFSLFAKSPASEYQPLGKMGSPNPIACLSEAVSRMEQATSLSLDNGSLESFLHKSAHAFDQNAAETQDAGLYSITPVNTYAEFDFSPEHEFTVELTVSGIEEGDFEFNEDNLIINASHAFV